MEKKEAYAIGVIQLKPMPLVEQLVQNQYHVKVATYGLEQLVLIIKGVHVKQTMATTLHVNIPITTRLLVQIVVKHVMGNKLV